MSDYTEPAPREQSASNHANSSLDNDAFPPPISERGRPTVGGDLGPFLDEMYAGSSFLVKEFKKAVSHVSARRIPVLIHRAGRHRQVQPD
jgi:hypothetical protein